MTSNIKNFLATGIVLAASLGAQNASAEVKSAYFAGGCFWCIEKDFEHVNGVKEVKSGYQGGELENPTYRNHPGHIEAVKIDYDSTIIDYATLLNIYFRTINPTDAGGQFCDRGHQYSTAVFTQNDEELALANAAKIQAGNDLGEEIVTVIRGSATFWDAEGYHQNYYKKNPVRYKYYRFRCGRDQTVESIWGDAAYPGVSYKQKGS